MSRYVLMKTQEDGTHTTPQSAWNNRVALSAGTSGNPGDGVKLISYSTRPNRNPTVEEGLHTMSYTFIAGGVYMPTGTLEGYYRCDSNVGNGIIKAIFGSEMTAGEKTTYKVPSTLSYGSGPTPWNFDVSAATVYKLGSEIWPYTMQLVEDGPGSDEFIEFKNVLFQNLELTFDTREFPKFRVDYIAGPSKNVGDEAGTPFFSDTKPAAFYNAVIEICTDPNATTPVWEELGCKNLTLRIARKIDENYVYIGSPFLAGAALNGVTDVEGNFTTGAGATELELFNSIFHDESNTTTGEIYEDTNAMKTFAMRFALFDTDFKFMGFFNAGMAVLTEGNKTVQGRQVIERTINFKCYGEEGTMYFIVPSSPVTGTGGQFMAGAFKGLAREYAELTA